MDPGGSSGGGGGKKCFFFLHCLSPSLGNFFSSVARPAGIDYSASVLIICADRTGMDVDLESFLAGLRVLAVDDDLVCLKILEMQLRHYNYNGEYVVVSRCFGRSRRGPYEDDGWIFLGDIFFLFACDATQ
jgi:hypothetical protein